MLKKLFKASIYFCLFIGFLMVCFYIYLAMLTGKAAEKYQVFNDQKSKPLVIAHRGGAGIAPENTLEAFRRSEDLGVDVLELDVHATKDGELVVIHDRQVERTTDGKGLIAEMNLADIKKLDAGFRWDRDENKKFPFRGKDVKIPTLREVFEEFPTMKINIELKTAETSNAKTLCGLINEFKRTDKSIVASGFGNTLTEFRAICPNVATSASFSESTWFLAMYQLGLAKNYETKMQALQIPPRIFDSEVVTEDFVEAVRERNLQIHVWTINREEDMRRLLKTDVDGIMTDYPDRLLKVIGNK